MIITAISDTHNKHDFLKDHLIEGDLIICAGDISGRGFKQELINFCKWFDQTKYKHKIFIAGNHDFCFQDSPEECKKILKDYNIIYLQDDLYVLGDDYNNSVKIYGSPWQPEFYNWAFNLPRNSQELYQRWNNISDNTDILITHGPSSGHLDKIQGLNENIGCGLLSSRIEKLKPKIHIFGHIHSGYGYEFNGITHYFNASVSNERYEFTQKPFSFHWNKDTNEINFIN